MSWQVNCVVGVFCLLFVLVLSQDPAPGWLGYAKASGNGVILTHIEAKWKVPSNPTQPGLFFGIWFGIEPDPALNLIQPVLPWTGNSWQIYNEYFQWQPQHNFDSASHTVKAGQTVYAYVTYNKSIESYTMYNSIMETGWGVMSTIPIQKQNGSPKTYTDAYFVMEKDASSCKQYSPDGQVTFYDIVIEWDGAQMSPSWSTAVKDNVCDCRAHILNETAIQITWSTS